ncbi:MAG TPA: 1-deoxy-D-xylulose-5-phosphate synthase [Candidatus Nanoarchaeia archaeon]|nr:1-deoxy-D-xylulose-5-phosphate synthase [Candidatus Nanoarchaeia archaeon]
MKEEFNYSDTVLLDSISSPQDLKKIPRNHLKFLAREIRHKIIDTVSKTGGHLGSPLGCVELAIALHYVFESPCDKIIWDVGHQAYAHKILTGRNNVFHTLRQYKGISGFIKPEESVHDAFGVGHSSTSISAALGMAIARDLKKENHKIIAVIGDGALTAGMAYEALNHAGHLQKNMIVILNDNKMSINPNVGALSKYLRRLVVYPEYHALRKKTKTWMLKIVGEGAVEQTYRLQKTLKKIVMPLTLFEEFGFRYFGPIDGHNINDLINALENIKNLEGPLLLHVITEKGKGYNFAERDKETKFHGVSPFNVSNGKSEAAERKPLTFTEAFSEAICNISEEDPDIVAITPAMKSGSGLTEFSKRFPERFFDVGIAEQHAVSLAAGMAIRGLKPVCSLYSTFFQRAYDQFVHDVCIQNLNVAFAVDRAGLVGEDGPTHHGTFDIAFMRSVPNITIMAPKDENELQDMLYTAVNHKGPAAVRFPRGHTNGYKVLENAKRMKIGKSEVLRKGKDIAILSLGPLVGEALKASEELDKKGIDAAVINARFAKPLDEDIIIHYAKKTKNIITLEEGTISGGFGAGVLELLEDYNSGIKAKRIGIPDKFIEHGNLSLLRKKVGLNASNIAKESLKLLEK